MIIFVTLVHVAVSLFLIVVVLLQSGKAADLAGAFGGMGSQTVFGPRGSATVLSKATTISAVLFMVTSLTLSILATGQGSSTPGILQEVSEPVEGGATPAATPAPEIQVTPSIDGGAVGETQTIPVPSQEAPAPEQ